MPADPLEGLRGMDEDGQLILLTALVACLFIAFVALCLCSVDRSAQVAPGMLSRDRLDNALWAHDASLDWSAAAATGYAWDRRYEAAKAFRDTAAPARASLEKDLRRQGIACSFAYNDTAARDYIGEKHLARAESVGGIIVGDRDGEAVILGCGYDLRLSDRQASYQATRLKAW